MRNDPFRTGEEGNMNTVRAVLALLLLSFTLPGIAAVR